MKILSLTLLLFSFNVFGNVTLCESIFEPVPFSTQYAKDGALIMNIHYSPVNDLVPQLNKLYNLNLDTRGEAHITVIRPPEAQGWFTDKKGINYLISTEEIFERYSETIQLSNFEIKCVGRQTNADGNTVFYLVVDSPELLRIRKEIEFELRKRAGFTGMKVHFNAKDFSPHITIGYVGSDIHEVDKGMKTCVQDIDWVSAN